jgi:acylphosphatase
MPLSCRKVLYSGRVQGVGFRYTARRIAQGLAVGGYVKNLPSGSVELLAEGEPEAVEALLQQIAEAMAGYIHETKFSPEAPQGFREFQIRH